LSRPKFNYEKLLGMIPEQRREYLKRKQKKNKKKHSRQRERTWTKAELIEFLRENNVRSSKVLRAKYTEPKVYDYQKHFGSWGRATAIAFCEGNPADEVMKRMRSITPEYLARLCIEARIKSKKEYIRHYKERPDIFPSFWQIHKHFGGWKPIRQFIKRFYIRRQLEDYIEAVLKEGRHLTVGQCKKRGIHIDVAVYWLGGKRYLNRHVEEMIEKLEQDAK